MESPVSYQWIGLETSKALFCVEGFTNLVGEGDLGEGGSRHR